MFNIQFMEDVPKTTYLVFILIVWQYDNVAWVDVGVSVFMLSMLSMHD